MQASCVDFEFKGKKILCHIVVKVKRFYLIDLQDAVGRALAEPLESSDALKTDECGDEEWDSESRK
jgi:hypothetical protein